mmetsp:Transcript_111472/g.311605  ORF Transcript_111472/g.311605 Transcript_111472/m.311605 type:complete len:306 (-) Transcript_111472:301-1218(-)
MKSCTSSSLSMRAARYAASNRRFSVFVVPSSVARTVAVVASAAAAPSGSRSDMSQRPRRSCTKASMRRCSVARLAPMAEGVRSTSRPIHRSSWRLKPMLGAANLMSPLLQSARRSSLDGSITASSSGLPASASESSARSNNISTSEAVYDGKATWGGSRHGAAPTRLRGRRPTKARQSWRPKRRTSGKARRISAAPGPRRESSWEWSRTTTTRSGAALRSSPWPSSARRLSRSKGRRIAASKRSTARSWRPGGIRVCNSFAASPAASTAAAATRRSSSASRAWSSPRVAKQAQFKRTCGMPISRK